MHVVTLQACIDIILRVDAGAVSVVNHFCHSHILDVLMPLVTELGNGLVLAAVWAVLHVAGGEDARRTVRLAIQAFIVVGLVVEAAKHLVGRARPLGGSFDSFPSGHTSEAFCAACIYGDRWRRLQAVFYALAAIVGFSRVYLMMHYPLDVVAGAAIGAAGAAATLEFARRKCRKRAGQPVA